MAIFTGSGVAIITPMKENGEVNFEKLEELVNFHVENGTDAIIICGTTGESATLTEKEHSEVIKACIQYVNKRIPVIAGTGSNCTKTAIELSQAAEKEGADGLLIVTPYYNKATQDGLKQHFKAIADAVNIPIIMYNIPPRTGYNMTPQTIADLFHSVDNIVGIKEASGDISQVAKIMELTDRKIDLYSGNDDQIVPVMSLGGRGVISVVANILPNETHNIAAKYLEGDVKESLALQMKYFSLCKDLFIEVSPAPIKKAMNLMGMNVGGLRLPLTEMSTAGTKVLEDELKKLGIL